jgi:hypothetical protein
MYTPNGIVNAVETTANHVRLGNTVLRTLASRVGHVGEQVSSIGSIASLKITIVLLRKPIRNAR